MKTHCLPVSSEFQGPSFLKSFLVGMEAEEGVLLDFRLMFLSFFEYRLFIFSFANGMRFDLFEQEVNPISVPFLFQPVVESIL